MGFIFFGKEFQMCAPRTRRLLFHILTCYSYEHEDYGLKTEDYFENREKKYSA